jgi:hypothetical protein
LGDWLGGWGVMPGCRMEVMPDGYNLACQNLAGFGHLLGLI